MNHVDNYNSAYVMFICQICERFNKEFQEKYKVNVLFFYYYGYRQWESPASRPRS